MKEKTTMVKWYLPTFYGDIRLESQDKERTLVVLHGLTPEEQHAAEKIFARALETSLIRKPWATERELRAIDLDTTAKEQRVVLMAPITDAHKVLATGL